MLVLSRHCNQSITVGDGIVITVVEIRRGCVRLGIDAPKEVVILRDELTDEAGRTDAAFVEP